jgi:magnesium-transporting ATPase (P-type)
VCSHVRSSGQDHPIDDAWRTKVTAANDRCAAARLRVLAAAVRYDPVPVDQVGHINATPEELERGLTFLGLLAMRDVPRPEVHDAVEKCHRAGIRVVMITGDYGLTAQTIARDVGIVRSDARVITGVDIDAMDASTHDSRVEVELDDLRNVLCQSADSKQDILQRSRVAWVSSMEAFE